MFATGGRVKTHSGGWRVRIRIAGVAAWMIFILLALHAPFGSCSSSADSVRTDGDMSRDLIDPCLGSHWQLKVNPEHPGWPARLVLVGADAGSGSSSAGRSEAARHTLDRISPFADEGLQHFETLTLPMAIRAGESLIVEQDSPVLHAEFQAIALASASVGQGMRVRLSGGATAPLSIKGKVISVIATGAGRARWAFEEEVKP
jgi:hypothetical protein